jgi:hypothetical protein
MGSMKPRPEGIGSCPGSWWCNTAPRSRLSMFCPQCSHATKWANSSARSGAVTAPGGRLRIACLAIGRTQSGSSQEVPPPPLVSLSLGPLPHLGLCDARGRQRRLDPRRQAGGGSLLPHPAGPRFLCRRSARRRSSSSCSSHARGSGSGRRSKTAIGLHRRHVIFRSASHFARSANSWPEVGAHSAPLTRTGRVRGTQPRACRRHCRRLKA